MKYKVITLTQPWATLVAIGAKKIETRSWGRDYRGPLLIHAAKGLSHLEDEKGLITQMREPPFRKALLDAGITTLGGVPRGVIIAVCNLTDVFRFTKESIKDIGEPERSFGDFALGRYGWRLENVRQLETPILARGQLGLWDWEGTLE